MKAVFAEPVFVMVCACTTSGLYILDFVLLCCLSSSGKDSAEIATHTLQFVFLGNTGFRLPVCHFPTKEVDPAILVFNFWRVVGWLGSAEFKVAYACLDGGTANRSFVLAHFSESLDTAISCHFSTPTRTQKVGWSSFFDPWVSVMWKTNVWLCIPCMSFWATWKKHKGNLFFCCLKGAKCSRKHNVDM